MPMKELPSSTVKLITSTQIITTVSSVVKELMENALDAEATNIDVKLESNGLDRIEVKDDGCGIKRADTPHMCLPSYTSKICEYADLEKLQSYGFRGEALSAICRVADVTVTTRTSEDEFATAYTLNNDGNIVTAKPSHFSKGTLVTVSGLFRNIPVRKHYLNSGRRAAEELKRVDNTVKSLAVIHPGLRVTFCHNKCLLWQKSACTTLRQSLMQIVGHFISRKLEELVLREAELSVDMLVPRRETENLAALCSLNVDCMMLYINNRPVRYKKLEKMVLKPIAECFPDELQTHKYPYCLVSIVMPPGKMDVNLEPNKTRVLLKEEDEVLSKIENLLSSYYGVKEDIQQMSHASGTTAVPEAEPASVKVPGKQHNFDMNTGKVSGVDEKGRECKRMKIDTAVLNKVDSNAVNICTGAIVGHYNTFIPETNPDEQSEKKELTSHLHCKKLPLVPGREHEGSYDPLARAVDIPSTNLGDEVAVHSMDMVMGLTSSTATLNEADLGKNIMQETRMYTASSTENPVTKEGDFNFFLGSDFDEEIEFHSPNDSNTVLIPQDRSSSNQNFWKSDADKQACSTGELVSDVMNTTGTPLSAVGEDVQKTAHFSKENWSKGQVKAPNNKVMQGSLMLLPKGATTPKSAKTLNSSYHSVSSQMGCKEQSAFTKFARQERPKVLQEFPGIAFTKVSELLVERWRALSADERIRYENLAKEVDYNRKHSAGSISGEQMTGIKNFMNKSASSKNVTKRIWQRPYRREVALNVSLKNIQGSGVPVHKELGDVIPVLIGQLRPSGTWLYRKENELGVVRHWGLQETVVYHRLMVDHTIPLKKLDTGIPLDESTLGPDLWKVLLSLNKTYDVMKNVVIITSDVISKNGFRIELMEGSGRASCMVTETASTISFYGVNDLKDVLELIKKNGFNSLEKCRSQRVICYIRDEAVRIVRQCPGIMERETLQDLIHYWHSNLTHLGATCLHRKPFFFALRDLAAVELKKQKD